MNKWVGMISAILCGLASQAQQVNYNVTYDNPDLDPVFILNLEFLGIDGAFGSPDAFGVSAGIWGSLEPVDFLGVDYKIRRSYWTSANLGDYEGEHGYNFQAEAGVYMALFKRLGTKSQKIHLSGSSYEAGNSTITITNSIHVPIRVRRELIVRGGYCGYSSPYSDGGLGNSFPDTDVFSESYGRLSSQGVYLGIGMRTIKNAFLNVSGYGEKHESGAEIVTLDILLLHHSVTDPFTGDNVTDLMKPYRKHGNVGVRLTYTAYEIEKRSRTHDLLGFALPFEIGWKPYMGFYLGGGMSVTIINKTRRHGA